MAKPIYVDRDRWRDAVKFLMGLGASARLSYEDQRKLRATMRGPFANGMTDQDAVTVLLTELGWKKAMKPAAKMLNAVVQTIAANMSIIQQLEGDRFVATGTDDGGRRYWWNGVRWTDDKKEAALLVEQIALVVLKRSHPLVETGIEKVMWF